MCGPSTRRPVRSRAHRPWCRESPRSRRASSTVVQSEIPPAATRCSPPGRPGLDPLPPASIRLSIAIGASHSAAAVRTRPSSNASAGVSSTPRPYSASRRRFCGSAVAGGGSGTVHWSTSAYQRRRAEQALDELHRQFGGAVAHVERRVDLHHVQRRRAGRCRRSSPCTAASRGRSGRRARRCRRRAPPADRGSRGRSSRAGACPRRRPAAPRSWCCACRARRCGACRTPAGRAGGWPASRRRRRCGCR
jgi:hypothetical protein